MKREELLRHLRKHGCVSVARGRSAFVVAQSRPQPAFSHSRNHREIHDHLARKICHDLSVPPVKGT